MKVIEAKPIGYAVKKYAAYTTGEQWLRRRWTVLDNRFSPYIGDAMVWKTATAASRNIDALQPAYRYAGITLELVPIYREPKRFGDDALKPQD